MRKQRVDQNLKGDSITYEKEKGDSSITCDGVARDRGSKPAKSFHLEVTDETMKKHEPGSLQ